MADPELDMDEAQLRSAIGYLIGDRKALIYLEQALQKVVDSKTRLKAAEDTLQAHQAEVLRAKAELVELDHTKTTKLAELERVLKARHAELIAQADKALGEREARLAKLSEVHAASEAQYKAAQDRLSALNEQITQTEKEKQRADADLRKLRADLLALKQGIPN